MVATKTHLAKAEHEAFYQELLALLKDRFEDVRHWKPPASRPESPETFVIARRFRG